MTNDIDGVVDLGEILTITPWDGTNSFITCDMDQVLFNKYFSQIQVPLCVPDASAVNILITDIVVSKWISNITRSFWSSIANI